MRKERGEMLSASHPGMLQGVCGNEAILAATAEPQTKEVAVLLGVIVPNYCAEL